MRLSKQQKEIFDKYMSKYDDFSHGLKLEIYEINREALRKALIVVLRVYDDKFSLEHVKILLDGDYKGLNMLNMFTQLYASLKDEYQEKQDISKYFFDIISKKGDYFDKLNNVKFFIDEEMKNS